MTPEQNKIPYIIKNKVTKSQYDNPANFSEAEREAHIFEITNSAGEMVEGKSFTYTDNEGTEHTVTAAVGAEVFNAYEKNIASGEYAHAEGYKTFAIGGGSHAEGTRAYQLLANKQGTQSKITNISSDKKTITISPVPTNIKDEPVIKAGLEISFNLSNGTRTNDYKVTSFNNSTGVIVLSSAVKETISNGLTLSLLLSNYALEEGSHVEGGGNVAAGDGAHAEGSMNIASGESSHAEGKMGFSEGMGSHSEGYQTISSGTGSHSEGYSTVSSAMAAHAEGGVTTAKGMASHAEGVNTIAAAEAQHAQGKFNIEDTTSAHIVGNGVKNARSNAHTLDWDGNAWFAGDVYVGSTSGTNKDEGSKKLITSDSLPYELELGEPIISNVTLATDGQYDTGITLNEGDMYWLDIEHIYTDSPSDRKQIVSRAIDDGNDIIINWNREFQLNSEFFGVFITQENIDSVKINSLCKVLKFEKKNVPFGDMEGTDCIASGADAHVEGFQTQATNWNAHAEGRGTLASGANAHAEGRMTTASAAGCHSEGYNTTASGTYGAHAEGYHTLASGKYGAHAEGQNTKATTASSHAEGNGTKASGFASHAEGDNTIAASRAQHVEGRYNIEDTEGKYAHIVGNGEQELPSNAHVLDWDGNAYFAGNVYVGISDVGEGDVSNLKLITAKEVLLDSNINLISNATYNSSSKVYSVNFNTLYDPESGEPQVFTGMEVTIIPSATNGESARLCVNGSNSGRGHIIYLSTCVGTGGYKAIPAGYLKAGMPVRMKFTGSGWRITDYMYMPTWDDFNALLARVEALEAGGANNTFRMINNSVDSYQDFEYEKNMTWYDFVESEFNNTGEHFEIKEGPEYEVLVFVGAGENFPEEAYLVGSDAGEVLPEHLISMYSEYYITDSYDEFYGGGGTETSFEFEGEEYSFESGMTWDEYINSDYNTEHECSDGCGNTYKEFSDPYAEGYVHYSWTCPYCGGEPYTLYNSDGGLVSTDDRVRSGGSYTTSEGA